jgi:hypothetical protein
MIWTSLSGPLEAWRAVVGLVAAVTQPRADVAACDARVKALAADSRLVRALGACADTCNRAAADSTALAAWRRATRTLVPASLADRVRAVACIAGVAAATTLTLRIAGTGNEPLTWMLPAVVALMAVVGGAAAQPIARAISHYDA